MAEKSETNKADALLENPHLAALKGVIKNGVIDAQARITLKSGAVVSATRKGIRVSKQVEDNFQYPSVESITRAE